MVVLGAMPSCRCGLCLSRSHLTWKMRPTATRRPTMTISTVLNTHMASDARATTGLNCSFSGPKSESE